MEQKNEIVIGCDLGDEFAQLYVYNWKIFKAEPVHTSTSDLDSDPKIPMVLWHREQKDDWLYGTSALSCTEKGRAYSNLLSERGENDSYSRRKLLGIYLRKLLSLASGAYPEGTVSLVVIAIRVPEQKLVEDLYEALADCGLSQEQVCIRSYQQCFVYYALHQEDELSYHNIGLFDLTEDHLIYDQMDLKKSYLPKRVEVSERDLSEYFSCEERDHQFDRLTQKLLHQKKVSTIYLVGSMFQEQWMQEDLIELCKGRRLFIGQTLYAEGACLYGRELKKPKVLLEYQLYSDELIEYGIYLDAYHEARQQPNMLIACGTPWYDARCERDIIIDRVDSLVFYAQDRTGRKTGSFKMTLPVLMKRPGRMTRLRLNIRFIGKDTILIQVRDRGFGMVYEESRRIFEETVRLG